MLKKLAVLVAIAVVFLTVVGAAGSGLPQGLPTVSVPFAGGAAGGQAGKAGANNGASKQAPSVPAADKSSGAPKPGDGKSPASPTPTATPAPAPPNPAAVVTQRQAIILLNPATVMAGSTVDVAGTGFTPGATIDFYLKKAQGDQGTSLGFVQADQSGSFGGFNFTLPQDYAGRPFIVVGRQHDGQFEATAQGNATANSPVVKFGTQVGKPGDAIAFSAKGFTPGEQIKAYFNSLSGKPLATFQADPSGGLTEQTIAVPFGAVGNNSFIFVGAKSQSPVTVPFLMLNLYPSAGVSAYAAKADTVLTFSGSGFGPGERVSVHLNDPTAPPVAMVQADGSGGFAAAGSFRIPFSLTGKNTFILVGEQSQAAAAVTFEVLPYTPYVEPSTYGGRPGTTLTFYGSGFASDETVHIYVGATHDSPGTEVGTLKADAQGNVRAGGSYTIPANAQKGTLQFRLVGDKSKGVATTAIQVTGSE